jgi:hypothetical protein
MTTKIVVLTALLCIASGGPELLGQAVAGPIPVPAYFDGEHVGGLCLNAVPPGESGPIPVLVQFNFDHVTQGGISLERANSLFAYYTSLLLGILSPVIGSNPQPFCSFLPSLVPIVHGIVDALDAVQKMTPAFQQLGFQRYYIVDSYLATYAVDVESIVRSEVFRVDGANALTYVQGFEIAEAVLP